MKKATIKDVAALAGVSFATVSRALDDRPEIRPETKAKVLAACEQLGYVRDLAARSLAGQATYTLGLVVPDISNPYYAGMATEVVHTAAKHGYRVLLSNSMRKPEQELQAIDSFAARQIDGILISAISPQTQLQHKKILGDLPCIYLGANHDGDCNYVMSDNERGTYDATRYLISLGHRDILFLGGRESSRTRSMRIHGFQRALGEEGLTGRMIPAPSDVGLLRQWSYECALELLKGPLPDAIFAFSDLTALKVLEAAEVRGVHIPEDVSLMGYDNVSFARLPRIHLTTVSQKKRQQGRIAVEKLIEIIQGQTQKTEVLLQPKLMIRSTCRSNTK